MTETAWLIERYDRDGRAMYWAGTRLTGDWAGNVWLFDSARAVRFSREIDATTVARSLPAPSGTAHEHMWIDMEEEV